MWLGIVLNLLPLLVFACLLVLLMQLTARWKPRYGLEGDSLVVTLGQRNSSRHRLDRAARVVVGQPFRTGWFNVGTFVDVLDSEGNLIYRFASRLVAVTELRKLIGQLETTHSELQIEPEVQAIFERGSWPRAGRGRLWPIAIGAIVVVFFVIANFVKTSG